MRNALAQKVVSRESAAGAAGFTLIEILVVIGIISLLMVWLLPNITAGKQSAMEFGCRTNLTHIYQHIQIYENRHRKMPGGGGPRMLWNLWHDIEHTEKNRDLFFCPAVEDPYVNDEIRRIPLDDLWRNPEDFTSRDTHYACRAKRFYKGMHSGREAWIADDNEGGNNHRSGGISILFGDGTVKDLTKLELEEKGLWGGDDDPEVEYVFPVGPDSPYKPLQKLDVGASQ